MAVLSARLNDVEDHVAQRKKRKSFMAFSLCPSEVGRILLVSHAAKGTFSCVERRQTDQCTLETALLMTVHLTMMMLTPRS